MLRFERVESRYPESRTFGTGDEEYDASLVRAKIPGGWLVASFSSQNVLVFVPDPEHGWDGSSLP